MNYMKSNKNGVKLLAAVMVLAVALAGAFIFVGNESDAAEEKIVTVDGTDTKTIAGAIASGATKVILGVDITEDVKITSGNIEIDLNGHTITNATEHTINVSKGATLTVSDSSTEKTGKVDNVTHEKGALYNSGTVTLNGGEFLRSEEKGVYEPYGNGGNSWYTVYTATESNTTISGAKISNSGGYSSNIRNDGNMTISAGSTITGGLNAVKNDAGTLTIDGGSIQNSVQSAIMNWNDLTVNGGTISCNAGACIISGQFFETEAGLKAISDVTSLTTSTTINGGTFTPQAGESTIVEYSHPDYLKQVALGKIIIADDVTGVNIILPEGVNSTGSISFGDNKVDMLQLIVGDDIEVKKGSLVISGTIDASASVQITASGEVKIDGVVVEADGIVGGLTINTVAGNNNKVIIQDLTVQKGAKLEVGGTTSVDGTMKVMGTVDVNGGSLTVAEKSKLVVDGEVKKTSGTFTNDGTIQITNTSAKIPSSIDGKGTVDASSVAVDGTISGEFNTDTTFTQNQTITMTADTYLVDKTILTIQGKLIIPEGVTLYIRDDARLVVSTSTGLVENNGTIVVESKVDKKDGTSATKAGALVIIDGTVENNGTINLAYSEDDVENPNVDVSMNNTGTLINNGEIIVGEDSFFYMWNDVQNLGTITMNGTIMADDDSKIVNSGEIVLNGIVKLYKLTIDLKTEDATIQFVSVEKIEGNGDAIEITTSVEKKNTTIIGTPTVTVGVTEKFQASGLVVSATLVRDVDANGDNLDTYTRNLIISGNVVFSTDEESASAAPVTITTTGSTIVDEELNLSAGVILNVNGPMLVSGNITSVNNTILNGTKKYGQINATGTITVTGSIVTGVTIDNSKINAAFYTVAATVSTPVVYNYTTLDKAISTGATKIEMLGANTVSVDVSVPNGTTVDIKGATTVGADSTVTFAAGAIMKGTGTNSVSVKGTLVFEDKKTGDKNATYITSDVIKEGEKDRTYTNITTALAGAASGDTVKLKDSAKISRDTVINEGVTLDTNDNDLEVMNDVTLTVNGTLFLNNGKLTLAEKVNETQTSAAKAAGKLVLNGTLKSTAKISDDLKIAGAYYSISEKADTFYFVQPVATAAPVIATVDDLTIEIKSFDTDMDVGNVSFTGTVDDAAVVKIVGKLKTGTVTIDNAKIEFDAKAFTGTVTNSVGTVALEGTATATFVISSEDIDDVKTLIVSGNFDAADEKIVTVSGDATFKGFNADIVSIDGNVIVLKDATSTITDLTVNGTVTVNNGATLVATTLSVYGTVDAKAATTSAGAGSVRSENVFVGLGIKDITTDANASISGAYTIADKMYVADGASVPETLVDGKKSLQVFVEDKLWMTVYAMGSDNKVEIEDIPVENVELNGWVDDKGASVLDNNGKITINDNKVYAKINYNVYTVKVQVAEGIDDVYMDGVLMTSGINYVKAGQHTISYTLSNGYGGEATMLVNGEKVTGYTFTASGEFGSDEGDYVIVLQDIEKTGYTPNAPDNNGGSDGMSITDILLIVLVVLIVIMAILVAIRMMRS